MWRACAFDDEGNLYAVRAGETLCDFAKIDKTTGAAEVMYNGNAVTADASKSRDIWFII